MLDSILGARLSWHFANGWVFEPAIVGPDNVEYTLTEGPHAGRHAIQHFYYLLRVSQDDDDGVIRVDDDPIRRTAPLGVLSGAVVGVVTALPSG
jgi:hypothetical protein